MGLGHKLILLLTLSDSFRSDRIDKIVGSGRVGLKDFDSDSDQIRVFLVRIWILNLAKYDPMHSSSLGVTQP